MPRPRKLKGSSLPLHADILEMALTGYEAAKMKIENEILAIKKALGAASQSYAKSTATEPEAATRRIRRTLSAKARKAISKAQKLRWKTARAAQSTVKTAKTKVKRAVKKAKRKAAGVVPF